MLYINKPLDETLHKFYRAYQDWLDNPELSRFKFMKEAGLCSALSMFLRAYFPYGCTRMINTTLSTFMSEDFEKAGLHPVLPFNNLPTDPSYWSDVEAQKSYLNPRRREWVAMNLKRSVAK